MEGGCERNKVPIPLGRGAFNVSYCTVQWKVAPVNVTSSKPLGRGAFNVPNIVQGSRKVVNVIRFLLPCTIGETFNALLPKVQLVEAL